MMQAHTAFKTGVSNRVLASGEGCPLRPEAGKLSSYTVK